MQYKAKMYKAHWVLTLFLILFFSTVIQAQNEQHELTITVQPAAISIVQKNQAATLFITANKGESDATYQWFISSDNTITNGVAIEGAIKNSYTTEVFNEKEIRYYYCIASVGEDSIISNIAIVAYTGLPVLYVNTPGAVEIRSKKNWTEGATLSLVNAEKESWNFENMTMSIRGRGNTTWGQPKKPYAIKLDKKSEIMGMPKHKRWVLIANYLDNSFLKNHMAFFLSEQMDMDYTVRGKFVDLVFNGVYRGLYWLGEAIKVDKNRVDINDGNEEMTDDMDKDYLIEMDNHYDEIVKFTTPIRQLPYMIQNDDYMINEEDSTFTSGGEARLQRLMTKIEKLEKLLYPDYIEGMNTNNCTKPNESYTKIIDVISWAKFWLINEIMDNGEIQAPKSCFFSYNSQKNVFKAGPVWDFDYGFLKEQNRTRLYNTLYFNALFKSPLFVATTKKLWEEYRSKLNVELEIESMREYLKIAAKVDSSKWGVHLDPSKVERSNYDAYVDFLKISLNNKIDSVNKYVKEKLPNITLISPTLTLSSETFEYNGSENRPSVTVTDEENALIEGVDYSITYFDNINAGTAKVHFSAFGKYAAWQEIPFTITPKSAILNVASDSKTYGSTDPEFTFTIDGLLAIDSVETLFTGVNLTRESGEDVGKYEISANIDTCTNPNYTIKTKNGTLTIEPDTTNIIVTIKGHSDTLVYNGNEQSVSGFDITSNNTYSLDFLNYTGDSTAKGTNVSTHMMGLNASNFTNITPNYTNVTFNVIDGNLVITPKEVSIIANNVKKIYSEEDPEFTYSIKGTNEKINDISLNRESGEDVGEYVIKASVNPTSNPNFIISEENGILTISPFNQKVIVSIKGQSDSLEYIGKNQKISGFDITSNNKAYSINFVSFTGDSVVSGTNVGTYAMGLDSSNFTNASVNFANVEFDITDGNLIILPKVVTLTAKNYSKIYGEKDPEFIYTIKGTKDSLDGISLKRESGENVGEYAIKAAIDAKRNPNYIVTTENAIFTIKPDNSKIIITIKGNTDTIKYDGKKHTIKGFEMTSSNEAYSLDFVSFKNEAIASGTKAQTYPMGLNANDFKNTSPNFTNVVFDIVDGSLTIVKEEEKKDDKKDGLTPNTIPSTVKVVAIDRNILVNGSQTGKVYAVFDLQGVIVCKGLVKSANFEIPVPKAGFYIVRVGAMTQHVNIK